MFKKKDLAIAVAVALSVSPIGLAQEPQDRVPLSVFDIPDYAETLDPERHSGSGYSRRARCLPRCLEIRSYPHLWGGYSDQRLSRH